MAAARQTEFRRQGIGAKLMDLLDAFAPELGAGATWLWAARHNAGAAAFWAARGFEETAATATSPAGEFVLLAKRNAGVHDGAAAAASGGGRAGGASRGFGGGGGGKRRGGGGGGGKRGGGKARAVAAAAAAVATSGGVAGWQRPAAAPHRTLLDGRSRARGQRWLVAAASAAAWPAAIRAARAPPRQCISLRFV